MAATQAQQQASLKVIRLILQCNGHGFQKRKTFASGTPHTAIVAVEAIRPSFACKSRKVKHAVIIRICRLRCQPPRSVKVAVLNRSLRQREEEGAGYDARACSSKNLSAVCSGEGGEGGDVVHAEAFVPKATVSAQEVTWEERV